MDVLDLLDVLDFYKSFVSSMPLNLFDLESMEPIYVPAHVAIQGCKLRRAAQIPLTYTTK